MTPSLVALSNRICIRYDLDNKGHRQRIMGFTEEGSNKLLELLFLRS